MGYSVTHRDALEHAVNALYQLDEAATEHCRTEKCANMCDGEGDIRHAKAPEGFQAAIQRARQAAKEAIFLITPTVTGIDPALLDDRLKEMTDGQ